jgi:hypothetical protein
MPTVDAKIGIGGQKHGISYHFGHTDKAGVSETHWHICVFLHEPQNGWNVFAEMERDGHGATVEQCGKRAGAAHPEQVESLRDGRFAGFPGRRETLR